jgi:manganese transport protein
VKHLLRAAGPGLITAALVFGPGSLTISTRLGAGYGYRLLWLIPVAVFFMIVFTRMAARIGISAGMPALQLIRAHYGRFAALLVAAGIFLITASFQSGNSIGAGLAVAELAGTDTGIWVMLFAALAILLLFFRSFYAILEKIMIALVGVMLVSFALTLLLVAPEPALLLRGFVPVLPEGAALLSIALTASSFSVAGAFFQSYLVREKGLTGDDAAGSMLESTAGIVILGLITLMVMAVAGAVLAPQGLEVRSGADMGRALEPLFGRRALEIFMIGLFAASFSSLIGNATLGGAVLADALGLGRDLRVLPVRLLIMGVVVTGAAAALLFGQLRLQLIVLAQGLTVLIAPLVAWFLHRIASDRRVMGEKRSSRFESAAARAGIGLLLLMAVAWLWLMFGAWP